METITLRNNANKMTDQTFYYHPIYTTIFFILNGLFYANIGYLGYESFIENKIGLTILYVVTLIFISVLLIKMLKVFVRLILKRPGLKLTNFRLYDHYNNIDLRWADLQQTSHPNSHIFSYVSIEKKDDHLKLKQPGNIFKRVFSGVGRFINRRRIYRINLLLLKGKNKDILNAIHLFSQRKQQFK